MTEKDYRNELKDKFITYRNSLNLPKNVTFGIEIEYENVVKDTMTHLLNEEKTINMDLNGWINKSEIDIEEYNEIGEAVNGEINSPILRDEIKTWKNLRNILNLMDRNGAIITEKCGGHVNIGSHIIGKNTKYLRNFILLWILYEKEINKFSSGEFNRKRNDIKRIFEPISKAINTNKFVDIKGKFNKNFLIDECLFDKCHAFHIDTPIKNKFSIGNRIEFRVPNASLSEEIWQNYINFFSRFLIACKKDLDIEYTLYKIKNNLHNPIELADFVFDNDIDKNNFLIQTLKTNKIYQKELHKHIESYKR